MAISAHVDFTLASHSERRAIEFITAGTLRLNTTILAVYGEFKWIPSYFTSAHENIPAIAQYPATVLSFLIKTDVKSYIFLDAVMPHAR